MRVLGVRRFISSSCRLKAAFLPWPNAAFRRQLAAINFDALYSSWRQILGIARGQAKTGFCALAILCGGFVPLVAVEPPVLPPLTSVSGSPRLPGKFVWADLVTDNVPAARKFYGQLFGWTFQTFGNYTIAANGERPLAGIFQRERPKDQSGHPRWFGYISVASVQRAERTVTRLGGRVLAPPEKVPKRGEQAVFADPEGALFGVVKSSAGDPEDLLAAPGDWIWIQLLSRDARKAAEFYRGIGRYDVVANTESNRMSDYVLVSEGYARATVRTIANANAEVRPTWLPFVRVKNVAESVARAKQLGGAVRLEPRPGLFEGKVAVIADPAGADVGLLQWSQESLKGSR
jgi:predicted enzyme related to lactoylglutathione lyase